MLRFTSLLAALSLCAVPVSILAADANPAEAKLRESLRNALLQVRTIQGERDTLQAAKTLLEQEKKTATDQAAALSKQLAADKEFADKAIAELKDKVASQGDQLTQVRESLDKWKASHAEATALAQKKEVERAALEQTKIELDRKVADQQTRNLGMYRIGTEILGRYEKFGLGTALAAREPFTGTMRVKLENLVQDYGDKLAGQRIKPDPAKPADAQPAPAPAAKPKPAAPKRESARPRSATS